MIIFQLFVVIGCSTTEPHICEHVCPECRKCTDKSCKESECADKCSGHKTEKVLDMVVVLGQSNAAGVSKMGSFTGDAPDLDLDRTFYYGYCENNNILGLRSPLGYGQGINSLSFGPEVGIAKYLRENDCLTNDLLVYKCAYGGTILGKSLDGNSTRKWGGTWTSPSTPGITEQERKGYELDFTNSSGQPDSGIISVGAMYTKMMNGLTDCVNLYLSKRGGYDKIRLVGIFWMQGENDTSYAVEDYYAEYLQYLINDIRFDYASLGIENAVTAPFVIGEMEHSTHLGTQKTERLRAEQLIAINNSDYTYLLDTDVRIDGVPFVVDKLRNAECIDDIHFGATDMIMLGMGAAKIMVENSAD